MKIQMMVLAVVVAACAAGPAHEETNDAALSLARAERAFAAQSVRENARSAFIAHFAPDAVLVRNGWTAAMPALEAQAVAPAVLAWHPAYVEAARSADLGLSTGPWTLTPHDPSRHSTHGHFVSLWGRESGEWKVLADIGISYPQAILADAAALEARVGHGARCHEPPDLDQSERRFATLAESRDVRSALRTLGARDVRFYREGNAPREGLETVLTTAAAEDSPRRYRVQAARVARSGELGFAYGSYSGVHENGRGAWLRVWRCEPAGWRVALDIANATR